MQNKQTVNSFFCLAYVAKEDSHKRNFTVNFTIFVCKPQFISYFPNYITT